MGKVRIKLQNKISEMEILKQKLKAIRSKILLCKTMINAHVEMLKRKSVKRHTFRVQQILDITRNYLKTVKGLDIDSLSTNPAVLKDLEATNNQPPGLVELINYGNARLIEVRDGFTFDINRIIVAEDDPITDISNCMRELVETNIQSRLKRNEFRLGLLLNLENSTWEDDFSLLQLDDTHLTKQQQIMEQATTVTYDYKSGIVNPEMWKKPLVDYKAILKKKKMKMNNLWGSIRKGRHEYVKSVLNSDTDTDDDDGVIETKDDSD